MPSLDCRSFPHLWDQILLDLDYPDKLRLRLVCHSLKDMVDKSLCDDIVAFRTSFKFYAAHDEDCWPPEDVTFLPFFSPFSDPDTEVQKHAVCRAQSVEFSLPTAPRVARLLQAEMDDETQVYVFHGDDVQPADNGGPFSTTFHLPPCSILFFDIWNPCGCGERVITGQWSHTASTVHVNFLFCSRAPVTGDSDSDEASSNEVEPSIESWPPAKCCVVPGILTPSVEDISVVLVGPEEMVRAALGRWLTVPEVAMLGLSAVVIEVDVRTTTMDPYSLHHFIQRILVNSGFRREHLTIKLCRYR
ncbi:hypothetical protein A1Q1_01525 [Trichosporon asahii var. asahii CBS 2479]|uniref:F-box domain-containing protein n=1 Tax=Trichosporon asahii var. asahii (strain ATCC 90039 / CBS 2479 / JCM 2466 / KCTC 7840 / NBRC 103889/ NCYC 2677 / UAMH 7654) TaxID=1186058 RepID=J5QVH8_TRIAS|nr:hypothetical protein A1Q1_01525 [Trichosporon asahii var. asahii CBS 2479]EJT49323.1 hypothetical protein A1Q1_01525 [Trichosporon asahii var. asahii CBS 2479]